MAVQVERSPELNGIYSKAAVLWTSLPTECERQTGVNCGIVNVRLSKTLLNFFRITENPEVTREVRISVYDQSVDGDGNDRVAKIFVLVEGKKGVFTAKSERASNSGVSELTRELIVERDLGHGMILSEHVSKGGPTLDAFDQIIELANLEKLPVEPWLLCRTCPAQVNGLPGQVV